MPDLYKVQRKYIVVQGQETSIALERIYWMYIEQYARSHGMEWRKSLAEILNQQPDNYVSRAGWVRYAVTLRMASLLTRLTKAQAANA